MAAVREVTRGCRYAGRRGGAFSRMRGPNSHADASGPEMRARRWWE